MAFTSYDHVVIHADSLVECYAASLWEAHKGTKIVALIQNEPLHLDDTYAHKEVLVAGAYPTNMPTVAGMQVTLFFNEAELEENATQYGSAVNPSSTDTIVPKIFVGPNPTDKPHSGFMGRKEFGFLTWTVQQLNAGEVALRVALMLDRIQYGYPTDEDLNFQAGMHAGPKNPDISALDNVKRAFESMATIDAAIETGRANRAQYAYIVEGRCSMSKVMQLTVPRIDKKLNVRVAFGDSPTADSALELASDTGIGMLIGYDLAANRTLFAMACTAASNHSATELMRRLVKGSRGSRFMAVGSLPGMCLFSRNKAGQTWADKNAVALGWLQHVDQ